MKQAPDHSGPGDSVPSNVADLANAHPDSGHTGDSNLDGDLDAGPAGDEPDADALRLIGSVPLYDWERNALKDYHSLIHTPRGATRFLNTYRLVRAGVPQTEWVRFCGDEKEHGEFRIPMLLLAVAAGQPSIARDWFTLLRHCEDELPSSDEIAPPSKPAWSKFRELYDETLNQLPVPLTRGLVSEWIDRVERFTF